MTGQDNAHWEPQLDIDPELKGGSIIPMFVEEDVSSSDPTTVVLFAAGISLAAVGNTQAQHPQQTQQHVVRFAGDQQERNELKANWHYLITHSEYAKTILKEALKQGDLTIRPANNDAYYDPETRSINVDPNGVYVVRTTDVSNGTAGFAAAPLFVVLGHELGHATGVKDDGPNHMNNVIKNENPIRHDLGMPDRTQY